MSDEEKLSKKEAKKKAREERRRKKKEEGKGVINEFKTFINRGSVVDLAVGVIIGSAFSAIVTAVTNIFLSICTWGIPGGINGLVSVLPAANETQAGIEGIGQKFASSDLTAMTIQYAEATAGTVIDESSETFLQFQTALLGKYTLHGGNYYYNGAALIDWGSLLNAIISFFLIAIVLFLIVRTINHIKKKNEEFQKAQLEAYYERHPEERPVPPAPGAPVVTELDVLKEIKEELKKLNAPKADKKE